MSSARYQAVEIERIFCYHRAMQSLSPRQQSILTRVIDMHVETAQPVGSRQITALYTELYQRSYSSATVRHEMGLLEGMGYLTHPHTSAGRVPTDRGYRYYVDHNLQRELPARETLRGVEEELFSAAPGILAERVSTILSRLSEQVGIVVIPEEKNEKLKCFVQGSSRLLDQPEFQDMKTIKPLLKIFEDRQGLQECFKAHVSQTVSVTIGEENGNPIFRHCSVVAVCYAVEGSLTGTVALLGPRRMRYSRMVSLVAQMGQLIESVLQSGRSF